MEWKQLTQILHSVVLLAIVGLGAWIRLDYLVLSMLKTQNLQNHENRINYQTFFERASNYVIVNLRDIYPTGGTFSSKVNMEMFVYFFVIKPQLADQELKTMQTCTIHQYTSGMPSF